MDKSIQKTLVLIKPDGVKRNLIGEIISRFEKANLKIVAIKMLKPSLDLAQKHYPSDEEYLRMIGEKSQKAGDKVDNLVEHGRKIITATREFITSSEVVAMILEGEEAIGLVRKITGFTDPKSAEKGTIRGDLGQDSILEANHQMRPVYNLIHASGNPEEAQKEIQLWFGKD